MRNFCQSKMASLALKGWTWDDEKLTRSFPQYEIINVKKRGGGIEWDSDKVLLWEHIRMSLGE